MSTSRTPKHSTKRGFSSAGNARLRAQAAAGESAKSGATSQKDSPLKAEKNLAQDVVVAL